ncbi:phage protease [Methyloversatilis sp. XJ19-49]|uniref:phage protease n=1 Tax=Methyloversatilis sp. XJ19-49 TaxID=2963429 RepID=UPI00211BC095|nr:phage protease [Methyloversatilis sp. XJ19-49]MCQ9378814.1 hypothetical protein [Methyloversatilis sp. XJ19-49]
MKPFEIFKAGQQTASNGTVLQFSEDDLREAVAAYDPQIHEAPITVGHPADNLPAYGWISALSYDDGRIIAAPNQVEVQFEEMVAAGRFKKRSASFYTPDSPHNPKPGVYYVRHVAFLGAQPPAVKGLKEIQFSADQEDGSITVEFADAPAWPVMRMFRNLREWLITKFDVETADMVAPEYLVEDLQRAHLTPATPDAAPAISYEEDNAMKPEQIAAMQAENEALKGRVSTLEGENTTLKTQAAEFSEREKSLNEREAAAARATVEARVDALIKEGRVLPAKRKAVVDFAMALADKETVFDFGEGDKAEKVTQREAYLRDVAAGPKVVDYEERAPANGAAGADASSPEAIADKARDLVKKAEEAGKPLSYTEAVSQVMSTAG